MRGPRGRTGGGVGPRPRRRRAALLGRSGGLSRRNRRPPLTHTTPRHWSPCCRRPPRPSPESASPQPTPPRPGPADTSPRCWSTRCMSCPRSRSPPCTAPPSGPPSCRRPGPPPCCGCDTAKQTPSPGWRSPPETPRPAPRGRRNSSAATRTAPAAGPGACSAGRPPAASHPAVPRPGCCRGSGPPRRRRRRRRRCAPRAPPWP
mmetsp:Transcript_24350/g.59053  ORF Transcript_24350/g.59053 Transcript_24350/m.59053 type:complete len:204 (-) Transcript_24350:235-846(-)